MPPAEPLSEPKPEPAASPARTKFSTQIPSDVSERARNAAAAVIRRGVHSTFAEFVEAALTTYSAELEQEWNDGKPFEQRGRRDFPPGRRMA